MKIRRIFYHFCLIPFFFFFSKFYQFPNDPFEDYSDQKLSKCFFLIEDRFKTIFQKKTKPFERKEISILLISTLAPVFHIYPIYIYILFLSRRRCDIASHLHGNLCKAAPLEWGTLARASRRMNPIP